MAHCMHVKVSAHAKKTFFKALTGEETVLVMLRVRHFVEILLT
jgi:hypothetical protein